MCPLDGVVPSETSPEAGFGIYLEGAGRGKVRQGGQAARREHVGTGSTYTPGMQGTRAVGVEHRLMISESSP